jgi:hypothetical protein
MAMTNDIISSVSFETIQNAMDYIKALISEGYPVAINPRLETTIYSPFEKKVVGYIVYTNSKKDSQFKFTVVGGDKDSYERNPN